MKQKVRPHHMGFFGISVLGIGWMLQMNIYIRVVGALVLLISGIWYLREKSSGYFV